MPVVKRTFATLRIAEFGFLGVRVITCTHTPRRKGLSLSAGAFDLARTVRLGFLTSWLIVGISVGYKILRRKNGRKGKWVLLTKWQENLKKKLLFSKSV
jgi:hypothetical protein